MAGTHLFGERGWALVVTCKQRRWRRDSRYEQAAYFCARGVAALRMCSKVATGARWERHTCDYGCCGINILIYIYTIYIYSIYIDT